MASTRTAVKSKAKLKEPKKNMNEAEFADWVESKEGRAYIMRKDREARAAGAPPRGLSPRARAILGKNVHVLISIRIPEGDLDNAKAIAERKGLPYQTYIKMLLHEALEKEIT